MARIPQDTIQRISDTADILDLVSDYVQLKRRGKNYFGLCPFHQEKTASFSVNPQMGIYHCFGCGRGGHAINFIMELEKVPFVDAVKMLGERLGIPVEMQGEDPRRKALVAQLYDLQELAVTTYQKNLAGAQGSKVGDYLSQRGIQEATWKKFRIGYALNSWDQLTLAAGNKKFSREALEKAGLFGFKESRKYDRFRSRIMFPITEKLGKVVALAGRIFENDDPAKYVNSPETPIYHKSAVLYGLSFSRNAIREADKAIIVEGYLDLIQLFQAGITNVVAVSGTALTDQQATELKKLTTNIALAYDGDNAGIQAAIRGGYTLLRNGLSPRVIEIPDQLDPDDWVLRDGPEPLLAAWKAALPILEFHKKHYAGNLSETGDMRKFLDETLGELSRIPDGLVMDLNLHQLADLTGIDEARLKESMQRLPKQRRRSSQANGKDTHAAYFEPTKSNKAQLVLVRLAFSENEVVLNLIADQGTLDLFAHDGLAELWKRILNMLNDGTVPDSTALMLGLEGDAERELLSKALMEPSNDDEALPLAIDCLKVLHGERVKNQIDQLRGDLRQLEKSGTQPPDEALAKIEGLRQELVGLDQLFEGYLAT